MTGILNLLSKYQTHSYIVLLTYCFILQVCDALTSGAPVVGKKRQAQTVKVKCCDTPLCNKMLIDYDPNAGHGKKHLFCH
jgi:hypothetical protein